VESWGYGGGRKGLEGLEGAVIKLRRSLVASFFVESDTFPCIYPRAWGGSDVALLHYFYHRLRTGYCTN
jgi:hypothetical protein